jgi:divalent metal cation (Fe/Co/Zn/Cd) transporter
MAMHTTSTFEFPSSLQKTFRRAKRYEWISFFYMISAVLFSFLMMKNSQTMKTVWLEDSLAIIPPLSFLICSKMMNWDADVNFPYGFHKVFSIGFLCSSLALMVLGIYLFIDGAMVLIKQEHVIIPYVMVFGHHIWFGYFMMLALLWSSIPSIFLGHIKIPLAKALYDKVLYADSFMSRASWKTGFVSILGISLVGLGWWWADATVGMLISLNIMQDGFSNLKQSVLDLIDEIPKTIDKNETDPLIGQVKQLVEAETWVSSAQVRFRDDGHVFFGEVFVIPKDHHVEIKQIALLKQKIENFHWRLHDVVIMPVDAV